MYGIVNKALEELAISNYGIDVWENIKRRAGVDIDFFISNEPYDDEITYNLAQAASDELGISVNEVLIAFGEWWILYTGRKQYGYLMETGGASFQKFMIHLPMFHNRIMMIYPKISPPEFQVTDIKENSLNLHYFSKRIGLKYFVYGLISGLGKFYQTPVKIELIQDRDKGDEHEIYYIEWDIKKN